MHKLTKKPLLTIYLIVLILSTIVFITGGGNNNIFIMILALSIVAFILIIPLSLPIFVFKLGMRKAHKDNMSKIDFKKDKDYYRDIILNYSPAELCYIDNLKNLEEKDVYSTILSLKLKKKITIDNKKINIIDDSINDLKQSEIYVLNHIKNNKVRNINYKQFNRITKNEAINDNLIKPNILSKETGKEISSVIIAFVIIKILNVIAAIITENNITTQNLFMDIIDVVTIVTTICSSFGIFFIIGYIGYKLFSFRRTDVGEKINVKLEGLKLFIKDFGDFKEREQKELILWEDYLIYSVLFNIDKKAIKELSKLI